MSPVQVSDPEDPNRTSSVPTASESSFLSESSSLSLTRLLLLSVPVPPPPLVLEATTTEGEDWKPSDKADRSYKTPLNPRPKAPLLTNEFDCRGCLLFALNNSDVDCNGFCNRKAIATK